MSSSPVATSPPPPLTDPHAPLTPPHQPVLPRSNRARQAAHATPSASSTAYTPSARPTPYNSQPSSTTASTPSTRAVVTPGTSVGAEHYPGQGPQMYRGDLAKMAMSRSIPSSASTSGSSSSAQAQHNHGYGGYGYTSGGAVTGAQNINGNAGSNNSLAPSSIPQTGAAMMAAAAKRGNTGIDGVVRSRRGSSVNHGAEKEEDDHPLSEKSLKARDYQTFHTLSHLFHLPSRWRLIRPLGQGAYGLVIQVQDTLSGEPIAVKCITRVFDKVILARRALREITLLRHFQGHENLTGLIDLDHVWHGYNEIYLYMEPMEADLHQIVRSGQPLSYTHIKYFLYQLLRGMKYIHSANVIHRDLKPGNLLVNSDCELKICDFGLARGFKPVNGEADQNDYRLTEYVATRWYRAPEIMLSNRRYTTAIDVWSIGCILAELLGGKPLFKGKDYVDQLNLILDVLGTPDEDSLTRTGSEKACQYIRSLERFEPRDLSTILPDAEPLALDLLRQLLIFDPFARITVVQALAHPYMAAYHDEMDEPSCHAIFDKWEQVEGLQTIDELREAITREIEEFRAEVRTVDVWSDEEELLEDGEDADRTLLANTPLDRADSKAFPMPPVAGPSTSPTATASRQDLGWGVSPTTVTSALPSLTRQQSRIRGAQRDRTRENSPHTPSTALSLTEEPVSNAMLSRGLSSRRTSTHSMHARRSGALFFSGMTPLAPMTQAGPSNANPNANGQAGDSGAYPNGAPTGGGAGAGSGMDIHQSMDIYSGRRSRAASSTGFGVGMSNGLGLTHSHGMEFSIQPIIRGLSKVGVGVGGDGVGSASTPGRRTGEEGEGIVPMGVSPSDAPASSQPKSFSQIPAKSRPPTPSASALSRGGTPNSDKEEEEHDAR